MILVLYLVLNLIWKQPVTFMQSISWMFGYVHVSICSLLLTFIKCQLWCQSLPYCCFVLNVVVCVTLNLPACLLETWCSMWRMKGFTCGMSVFSWSVSRVFSELQSLFMRRPIVWLQEEDKVCSLSVCRFMEMISADGNGLQRKKRFYLAYIYTHTGTCAQTFECSISSNCNVLTVVLDFICVVLLLLSKLQ